MRISDWSSDVCSSDLAEQVERLEDQHQREEDREGADEEQAADIERHRARREKMKLVHQMVRGLRWNMRSRPRIFCAALAATRSSAPIGCPPGTCAIVYSIQIASAAKRR